LTIPQTAKTIFEAHKNINGTNLQDNYTQRLFLSGRQGHYNPYITKLFTPVINFAVL
jgi:hypothetical protein